MTRWAPRLGNGLRLRGYGSRARSDQKLGNMFMFPQDVCVSEPSASARADGT